MEQRYNRNRVLQTNSRHYPKHKKSLTSEEVKRLALVFVLAVLAGVLVGGATAAVVLPIAYAKRGYFAFGSEWFLIYIAAYGGFSLFENLVFGFPKSRKKRRKR